MSIIYICDNCKKRFKLKDFMKLEMIYVSDDRNEKVLIPRARKCDSCGKEIKTSEKEVTK